MTDNDNWHTDSNVRSTTPPGRNVLAAKVFAGGGGYPVVSCYAATPSGCRSRCAVPRRTSPRSILGRSHSRPETLASRNGRAFKER